MFIETEHLIIRDFLKKDAIGLLEYLYHLRVDCFVGDCLYSEESVLAHIFHSSEDMLSYAVCLREDDFIIGDVFTLREYTDTFSVNWHFNKRLAVNGLVHEAATGLLDYLFYDVGARRGYGFVEDDNLRSKRLCERLRMKNEGCMKNSYRLYVIPTATTV